MTSLPSTPQPTDPISGGVVRALRNVAHDPSGAAAWREWAIALVRSGDIERGVTAARMALTFDRSAATLQRLAISLVKAGHLTEATDLLQSHIGACSADAGIWITLSDCLSKSGNASPRRNEARRCVNVSIALDPGLSAAHERAARHALRAGDKLVAASHFRALADLSTDRYQNLLNRGLHLLCLDETDDCDACFEAAGRVIGPRLAANYRLSLCDMLRYSRAFYDKIRALDFLESGSIIDVGVPPTAGADVLYMCCDQGYLDRFRQLITQNLMRPRQARAHLHVVNPRDVAELAAIAQKTGSFLTYEIVDLSARPIGYAPTYYASMRMVRARQAMHRFQLGRIAILDIDTVWQERIDGLFGLLADHDAVACDVGHWYPWINLNATITMYAANRPQGQRFFDLVARFIFHFMANGEARWRLDQCALSCCRYFLETYERRPLRLGNAARAAAPFVSFVRKS